MSDGDRWWLAFASIVSFRHHPGSGRLEHKRPTIPECAEEADRMMDEYYKRFPRSN